MAAELHNHKYKNQYCQCLDILDLDHCDCKSVLGSNKEALSTAECLCILPSCCHHLMTTPCKSGKVNVNKVKVWECMEEQSRRTVHYRLFMLFALSSSKIDFNKISQIWSKEVKVGRAIKQSSVYVLPASTVLTQTGN